MDFGLFSWGGNFTHLYIHCYSLDVKIFSSPVPDCVLNGFKGKTVCKLVLWYASIKVSCFHKACKAVYSSRARLVV